VGHFEKVDWVGAPIAADGFWWMVARFCIQSNRLDEAVKNLARKIEGDVPD
jgi:hypothetical protein